MSFFNRVLDPPSYGYIRNNIFYKPSQKEIFSEFFTRLNIFRDKKNWLPFFAWATSALLGIPFFIFLFNYLTIGNFIIGFFYSMVIMGSFGTFWFHRYATHRAFRFKNSFIRLICRNLVIKIIPDEVYVISHHVHHRTSEQPGDPYNVFGGWLYCFLADANHQAIARNLTPSEYQLTRKLLDHTGVKINSYEQYQKWGSLCHPLWSIAHYALNWTFWFSVFYLLGGIPLTATIFGAAGFWSFGVRTFNFEGHGRGKNRQHEGSDFYRKDLSVNQVWPGFVAGEWHNNHHLFPRSARSGFLNYQLDLPWLLITLLGFFGLVHDVHDDKAEFMKSHYLPYVERQRAQHA